MIQRGHWEKEKTELKSQENVREEEIRRENQSERQRIRGERRGKINNEISFFCTLSLSLSHSLSRSLSFLFYGFFSFAKGKGGVQGIDLGLCELEGLCAAALQEKEFGFEF